MLRTNSVWKSVDWWIILIYLLMVCGGWISVYGASYNFDNADFFAFTERSGKQLVWIGCAIVLAFIVLMIDDRIYETLAYFIYFALILLLVVTIVIAPEIKGSRSWLVFGPVSLQPAELAKFGTALALARIFDSYNFEFLKFKSIVRVAGIIILPIVCILLQRETGSALVYSSFLFVLFREGMPGIILFSGFCAILFFVLGIRFGDEMWLGATPAGEFLVLLIILLIALGMIYYYLRDRKPFLYLFFGSAFIFLICYLYSKFRAVPVNYANITLFLLAAVGVFLIIRSIAKKTIKYLWILLFAAASVGFLYSTDYVFDHILEPHQQKRIKVSLGMETDLRGAGYNVNQSKIAIGSGGLTGKGFLNGTQTKLKYVPEHDTDFIFCTVGEEFGFVGSTAVLFLFLILILRLIALAERQRTIFARVYGYCVASILLFHLCINIGMVLGITPVIGIPLPFFSYGGSSLWGFTILLFIFLRLDAGRMEKMSS